MALRGAASSAVLLFLLLLSCAAGGPRGAAAQQTSAASTTANDGTSYASAVCTCSANGLTVDCSRRALVEVPPSLPASLLTLNLSYTAQLCTNTDAVSRYRQNFPSQLLVAMVFALLYVHILLIITHVGFHGDGASDSGPARPVASPFPAHPAASLCAPPPAPLASSAPRPADAPPNRAYARSSSLPRARIFSPLPLLLLLLFELPATHAMITCPSVCACAGTVTDCRFKSLTAFPLDIDPSTTVL